jgi:hypothetical protein
MHANKQNPRTVAAVNGGVEQRIYTPDYSLLASALQSIRHHLHLLAACVLFPLGATAGAVMAFAWGVFQ